MNIFSDHVFSFFQLFSKNITRLNFSK